MTNPRGGRSGMREARTVDLGRDRSLHAVTAGDGRDVVLIHGALSTSHD